MTRISRPRTLACLITVALVTLATAGAAHAQGGTATAPQLVSPLKPQGGTEWSVFYGLGINQQINNSAKGINIATGGVRWSHMWAEHFGSFLRGHPTVAIEFLPVMAFVQHGGTTWGVGANLIYEHHFAVKGRVLPVWKLGAGFLYTNHAVPARETRHNFSLLTALGVDFMVNRNSALFVGYRFHHVSNANTGYRNPGINVHSIIFGLSFYR
ncbi:MAG: acyloxyacyl hydrolase [Acidobacteriota bacterium]|jgi:opacity protein-like surface antigen